MIFSDLPDDLKLPADLALLLPRAPHRRTWEVWRIVGCRGHKLRGYLVLGRMWYSLREFISFLEKTGKAAAPRKEAKCSSTSENPTIPANVQNDSENSVSAS